MLTHTDIAEHGERHVQDWLEEQGYQCTHNHAHHGQCDIEARSEENDMVVHVVAALDPNPIPDLSTSDRARVVSRAMNLGVDAWSAKVLIDAGGQIIGEIQWEQLNH